MFSRELASRERWLVLNKADLMPTAERDVRVREIVQGLRWKGPVFTVSAATGEGCRELSARLMERLEAMQAEAAEAGPAAGTE
jgi:GTP-binding protein